MSTGLNIIKGNIIEGGDCLLQARLIDMADNSVVLTSQIGALRVSVYDTSSQTPSTNIYTGASPAVVVSSVVPLTVPATWTKDSTGRNFTFTLLNADVTGGFEGGHVYRVQFRLNLNLDLTWDVDDYTFNAADWVAAEVITGTPSGGTGTVSTVTGAAQNLTACSLIPTVANAFILGDTLASDGPASAVGGDGIVTISGSIVPMFVVFELACDGMLT